MHRKKIPKSKLSESSQASEIDTHHREIWSDARQGVSVELPPVYYVENHNAPISYAEAALDFQILVEYLLPKLAPRELGNWTGPILHLARQTLELRLKALVESILDRDHDIGTELLSKHNLWTLWSVARDWLLCKGYRLHEDARLPTTSSFLAAFHAVDPTGDLFRFAQSRQERFGKRKSYDRVGMNQNTFALHFEQTVALLSHWEAVIFRERLREEMGWEKDSIFDPDDFPKINKV